MLLSQRLLNSGLFLKMSLSFLSPARTVLLASDEALYVYTTGTAGVNLADTVPWTEEGFVSRVAGLLTEKGEGKPALVLNDMVEQHYRKERVQRRGISVLDRASYVQRKLAAAFPNHPVKAGFPMKEKGGAQGKDNSVDIYLFAAVPVSEGFSRVVSAIRESLVPATGFFLLPIESSDMVKTLSAKLLRSEQKKNKWTVFIGQHRNGGLRQIVTKNGELALTRMTPISSSDSDPSVWSAELRQEYRATMSYLARFGYVPEDGLNVIVIANHHVHDTLQQVMDAPSNLTVLTVNDAARMLGLSINRQEDQRYADILHVAWAARKSTFILPMRAPQLEAVARPRRLAVAAGVLLVLSAVIMGYLCIDHFGKSALQRSAMEDLTRKKAGLDEVYEQERDRKEQLGFDVTLVQSSLSVAAELDRYKIDCLGIFHDIGRALGKNLRLESVTIERRREPFKKATSNSRSRRDREPELKPLYEARLRMLFPSTTDIDAGNKEVSDFRDRLEQVMPDREIKVVKFLKDYEYTEQIVVNAGAVDDQNLSQDFVSEIVIRGQFE